MFEIWWLIDKFILYLTYQKNSSPKTIENYKLRLGRMYDFFWNKKKISDIKLFDILDFRIFLQNSGLNTKTVNYHLVAIRSFLKFLHINDIDCINPAKIELAKVQQREVSFLHFDEIQKILDAPNTMSWNDIQKKRDLTILIFLFVTGMRVSELCNLKQNQINNDTNQIRILWKWNKVRSIFFTKKAKKIFDEYNQIRKDESEYVFTSLSKNSFGKKLSRNAIDDMVRKYAKFCWINKKVTPHTIRHSFATTLLQKWADIRSVQALLWHSSIQTTQIYTHVDDKYLQNIHKILE